MLLAAGISPAQSGAVWQSCRADSISWGHPRALFPRHTGPLSLGMQQSLRMESLEWGSGTLPGQEFQEKACSTPGGAGDDLGLSFFWWDIRSKHKASEEDEKCVSSRSLPYHWPCSCSTALPRVAESAPQHRTSGTRAFATVGQDVHKFPPGAGPWCPSLSRGHRLTLKANSKQP